MINLDLRKVAGLTLAGLGGILVVRHGVVPVVLGFVCFIAAAWVLP